MTDLPTTDLPTKGLTTTGLTTTGLTTTGLTATVVPAKGGPIAPAHFWLAFAARRIARQALLLGLIALAAFALLKASPVDPVDAYVGAGALRIGPEQRAQIAAHWGFDRTAPEQFLAWASNLLHGDLGRSSIYDAPVATILKERVAASLALMGTAWLLSGLLGFALGMAAATWAGSTLDRAIRLYAYLLASTPSFWLALLLLIVFSVALGWTPICCAVPIGVRPQDASLLERLHHLILPALTLTVLGIAQITLHTRAKAIEIFGSEIATYARAQGASRLDIAWRHGARNAALPALTIQFAGIGELFGGSVLAEQVFAYPGLGRATVEAGLRGDVPLLLAIALFTALIVGIGNTIADALYNLVDPRLRGRPGAA